jgi:hypothetical protein
MINVLVFPCASGIGQEIYNALKNHKDITLYGANSGVNNQGSILFGPLYIGNAPQISEKELCIRWLNIIINKYKIQCIYPAYDDACVWLKENEEFLMNTRIITSSIETTQICRSKKKTYKLFDKIIQCPIVYESIDSSFNDYPIFIKPECGEGSKGCHIIISYEELKKHNTPEHICIEYLPGEEYTVDCFTDINGKLYFVGPRIRSLARAGISIITESIFDTNNEFYNIADKINNTIKSIGAWFFQVKRDSSGKLCLMEIAPRIAGAMCLYRQQGINFPLLSIYTHMNLPVHIIKPKLKGVIGYKIYKNYFHVADCIINPIRGLYIDLDDTLILPLSKGVNTDIISIIYQAKMTNIQIFLITRHKDLVKNTLNKYCLHESLFDEIIHIKDTTSKEDYIQKKPALLIDDSFLERNSVIMDDIYTFDIDSLEIVRDMIKISYQRFLITHE